MFFNLARMLRFAPVIEVEEFVVWPAVEEERLPAVPDPPEESRCPDGPVVGAPPAMVFSEMMVSRSLLATAASLPFRRREALVTLVALVPTRPSLPPPTDAGSPTPCPPFIIGDFKKEEKTNELGLDGVARR